MMPKPAHPQLMNPARDPEEFIASSVYWHPLIFPDRTAVLDHLMLTGGNGYEWDLSGNIRSVYSHISPDYAWLSGYEAKAREYEALGMHDMAGYQREQHTKLLAIQADYVHLARTYGPVRTVITYGPPFGAEARVITPSQLSWTLLGEAPENVTPAWQRIISETRALFTSVIGTEGS